GDGVSPKEGGDMSQYAQKADEFSWAQFFWDNSTLQVLILALLTGIFLNQYSGKQRVVKALQPVATKSFWALHKVMYLAPIGAFGGMAYTVAIYGIDTLLPLGKLLITIY